MEQDAEDRSTGKLGSCKYLSQSSQANSDQGEDTAFKIIYGQHELWFSLFIVETQNQRCNSLTCMSEATGKFETTD